MIFLYNGINDTGKFFYNVRYKYMLNQSSQVNVEYKYTYHLTGNFDYQTKRLSYIACG